jgi:hypothetical protein
MPEKKRKRGVQPKFGKAMPLLGVRLPTETLRALQEAAQQAGVPTVDFVRQSLINFAGAPLPEYNYPTWNGIVITGGSN